MDDNEVELRVLSIDAWRDIDGGWAWNQCFNVGSISKADFEALDGNRAILKWFRDNGYLKPASGGKCSIDDDGHNVIVQDRGTGEPLFAIEYGPAY